MSPRIAINGFGRMGRLALRAAWGRQDLQIVRINEVAGDAHAAAHLLAFDSLHGRWDVPVAAEDDALLIDGRRVAFTRNRDLTDTPWDADIVVECTGQFKSREALWPYFEAGVRKVVVSAPVKDGETPNVVVGVNDGRYDPRRDDIVTAASCTTNCIAPVIDVVHRDFGIRHGSITTVHAVTNTQRVLDDYHKDLRRARASALSLIPTSTGSATAIAEIFPELRGRLDGLAVRVPMATASLSDCVFELEREADVESVNRAFREAAGGRLQGILGCESRPLVSADYCHDPRSAIVDTACTRVVNGSQLKVLAWYDNEWGYVNRMMELTVRVAGELGTR